MQRVRRGQISDDEWGKLSEAMIGIGPSGKMCIRDRPGCQPQPQPHQAVAPLEQRVRQYITAYLKAKQQQNSAHGNLRNSG